MSGLIDIVELALDWNLFVPKEMLEQYEAEINERRAEPMKTKRHIDARVYLDQIESIDVEICVLQEEVHSLFALATSVTAPTDKEPGGSNSVSDPVGNFGTKLADRRDAIQKRIEELFLYRDRRVGSILAVSDPTAKRVLYMHYVNREKFKDIADELNYSPQSISEYHAKGLREVQKSVENRIDLIEF